MEVTGQSDPPSWSHSVWFNFSIPDRPTADSPDKLAKIARVVQWAFDDKKLRDKDARNLEYRKAEQITKNKHKAEEVAKMTAKMAQGRNQRQAMLKAQRAAEETALAEKIKVEASEALQAADLESKEPIKGYLLVLQLCLKLLHSPPKLRQWSFKFPLGLQKALRWIILQQMKDVDEWLQDSGRNNVEFRAAVVCSTTLLLLRAEEMANDAQDCGPGINSSWCHFDGHGSGQVTTHTANRPHCRHDTARCRHSKTLQSLANLVKSFNLDENIYEALNPTYDNEDNHDVVSPGPEIASSNEQLLHLHLFAEKARQHGRHLKHLTGFDFEEGSDGSGLYKLLDRLRAILVQNSASESDWSSWDQDNAHRGQNTRDVDDVIIYRCLMVAFLFRTASDSTTILESGLWEHCVSHIREARCN